MFLQDIRLCVSVPQKETEEKLYQEALINALGEFADHLPDYQKIDIMMFIVNKVPGAAKPSRADAMLQHILLKSLLKVTSPRPQRPARPARPCPPHSPEALSTFRRSGLLTKQQSFRKPSPQHSWKLCSDCPAPRSRPLGCCCSGSCTRCWTGGTTCRDSPSSRTYPHAMSLDRSHRVAARCEA